MENTYYEVYFLEEDGCREIREESREEHETIDEAIASAWGAIRAGMPENLVKVQQFDENGDCVWDYPIRFEDEYAWSDYETAQDELSGAEYTEEMIEKYAECWKDWISSHGFQAD